MIKQTLIIIFLVHTFLTIHPEIYECKKKGKVYKLEFNEDATYKYTHPIAGIIPKLKHSSKSSEYSTEIGKWKLQNDTLVLMDSIIHRYDKSNVKGEYIYGQNYISITIVDEKNNPIPGIEVALNLDSLYKRTDTSGFVRFEYRELKKEFRWQEDSLIMDMSIGNDETGGLVTYIENEHANQFKAVIDRNPIDKKELRIRKLLVQNDALIFNDPSGMNNGQTIILKKKK